MSRIRSKNTKPELLVFLHLKKKGIYFQKHYGRVAGRPDIALPRKKKAVFIDGDFWHGRHFKKTFGGKKDGSYWKEKISKNVVRDRKQRRTLKKNGWKILQVWTGDLERKSGRDKRLAAIEKFLGR